MNAQVGGLPTLDGQDPDQHDLPVGIHERLPSVPMPCDRGETGGVEKLENIRPRLADPVARKLAGGTGCGHRALLSAKNSPILPELPTLKKCRDPSHR